MAPTWTPEFVVSPELAKKLIEKQFPALAPARLESWAAGWDNTVYLVNETFVFRFPRRQIAVEFIEKEARLLPRLAEKLPLAIPRPEFLGKPSAQYEWPFSGYRRLSGETLCRRNLGDAERAGLVSPLASFLKHLHGISPGDAAPWKLPGDTFGRMSLNRLRGEGMKNLETAGVNPDPWVPWFQRDYSGEMKPAVVHGDLYSRHFLMETELSGVIDWGDIHWGNPAVDLAGVYLVLPPFLHGEFRRLYGEIPDGAWALAGLRALFHASATLVYSLSTNDESLKRESERALAWLKTGNK